MSEKATLEKAGLLAIAIGCVIALTWISIEALGSDKLDPNAATLLGAIVAGLIATAGAVIQAIRGYSMSAQLGKVTDQLAASGPVVAPETSPPPAGVVEAAEDVAEAAQDRADQIGATTPHHRV